MFSMYITFSETQCKLQEFSHAIPCALVPQIQGILNSLLKAFQDYLSWGEHGANNVVDSTPLWDIYFKAGLSDP